MPDWATFAAFAGLVTSALLLLSHASRGVVSDGEDVTERRSVGRRARFDTDDRPPNRRNAHAHANDSAVERGDERSDVGESAVERPDTDAAESPVEPRPDAGVPADEREETPPDESAAAPSTALLLVNVAVSQGLFAALLLAGAWFSDIPAWAFGAGFESLTLRHALLGVGFGIALYGANELGAAAGKRFGLGGGEELREALAPETGRGWAVLLLGVLPIIAGFEELLFRGALVGVVSAGFDVSPWAMAVVSSLAFALGHGAQGRIGVVVTGVLGFVLAAGFVLTGSLLVVFVAHYIVNAMEFLVHEGFAERTT